MSCAVVDVVINDDVNDRLKESVEIVSGGNNIHKTILVNGINSGKFLEFCKTSESFNPDKSLAENNANTIRSLLRKYIKSLVKDVRLSATKQAAEDFMGFDSISAKDEAISGFATQLNIHCYTEHSSGKKLDKIKIINDVTTSMTNEFYKNIINEYIRKKNEVEDGFRKQLEEIEKINNRQKEITKELKELAAKKSNEQSDKNKFNELKKEYIDNNIKKWNLSHNAIIKYGNSVQKNFVNAIEQAKLNPIRWYNLVINNSKVVAIANEFKDTLNSDKLQAYQYKDDNDYTNYENDDTDEMTKNWEDKLWSSFDKAVSTDLKLYFNTLYKLSDKGEKGNENYTYDTNNRVGMKMAMGANFCIQQISSNCDFSSVKTFIDSLYNLSQTIPECYGFIQIVNKCIKDINFANNLFVQLCNPIIIKSQAIITESGIRFTQSNRRSDKMSFMLFNMMNYIRSTLFSNFDVTDIDKVNKIINNLSVSKGLLFEDEKFDYTQTIYNVLKKYYPQIKMTELEAYINKDNNDIENIRNIARTISNMLTKSELIVRDYRNTKDKYDKEYAEYKKKLNNINISVPAAPVLDLSGIKFDSINDQLIQLANYLLPYSKIDVELNSVNAEGNLASDLIKNNYITNLIKQIQFSNEQDANAGLQKLLNEVNKGEQYRYTPLFWGVKDKNGNYIQEGLFIRSNDGKTTTINPNAKKILSVSLFDGAKTQNNSDSVMYSGMSKADYFMTAMYAYFNPIRVGNNITTSQNDLNTRFAGYFMRTPSDASKNFIVQAPKVDTSTLFQLDEVSKRNYINNKYKQFDSLITNRIEDKEETILDILEKKEYKKNIYNEDKLQDFYDILNGTTKSINVTGMKYDTDNNIIPIAYRKKDSNFTTIVWIQGKKDTSENQDILYDIKVIDAYTTLEDNTLGNDFYIDIVNIIENEGKENGQIAVKVNTDNAMFLSLKQQLKNELNTFIDQLNNIFIKDKEKWVIRENIYNLIDKAHYNITYNENGEPQTLIQGEYLDKDKKHKNPNAGKLSGNFFKFLRLFDINGFNTQEAVERMLSLYGGASVGEAGGLINITKTTANINLKNGIAIEDKQSGRLKLNESNTKLDGYLNEIVTQWLNAYHIDFLNTISEYKSIIKETNFKVDQVEDFALNYANTYMSFDDVFEGDVKFYGDSRTFLKRAKEIQAAGKAYAGFDFNDEFSGKIKDALGINGEEQQIYIDDETSLEDYTNSYSPVEGFFIETHSSPNARNGFRAITIQNTVRPSKYAKQIRKEVFDILKKSMSEEQATKIAEQIYQGFAHKTKTNDAQSYITIEEFIRRRYADGTLNQYKDILHQLYQLRKGEIKVKDIDIANINARIQVQKNFYFDKKFDGITNTYYSRQIKNAEFVLIPELLEGTQLKELYNIMIKYDIGQVNTAETSKAAKRKILTFWYNDGNINPNFENDVIANNQSAIEDFYYKYLYKQQEVPEHMKDQANKFGIQFAKKVIDNASPEVAEDINNYFKAYCSNIKNSFNTLIRDLGWKQDKDGRIVNKDGSSILNFEEFYARARHEAQRLGMDENFIEYITPDNLGNPSMPNYMNNVSSKLESIAQAIFNRSITRQTLPGWHAAQVTQVGHKMRVLDSNGKLRELKYHPTVYINSETNTIIQQEEYDSLSEEEKSKYKIKQEAYAEVLIPRWSDLIPKDYTAEQLEKEGLDLQLAYRIPTEGKQSISIIKVVGFLDDVYGSTIMLPDEWVTQTGSDFDVDSVYGICFQMYMDKDKTLRKIQPNYDTSEKAIRQKYKNYVLQNIEQRFRASKEIDSKYQKQINEAKSKLTDLKLQDKNSVFTKALEEQNKAYNNLPKDFEVYKRPAININNQYKDKDKILIRYENMINAYNAIYELEENEENKQKIKDFIEATQLVYNTIALSKQTAQEYKLTSAKLSDLINQYRKEYNNAIDNVAKENNLVSYDDFKNWDIIDQQSQAARNNIIVQSIINIMNSESSREENYSRSNYDDIIRNRNIIDEARGANAIKTSTYNIFTQINYMEDAMSGASLKAFSVNRDTFNSINNKAQSRLGKGHGIYVEYDLSNPDYDYDTIINAYGLYDENTKTGNVLAIDKNGKLTNKKEETVKLRVYHNRLANSNNNRNVVGKLITVYSSQTTAHILDAIKEGSIYNENKFTFGSFKTLVDIGIDYGTAIAFLMQPAITVINKCNNEIDSIYSNNYGNAIQTGIKELVSNLGINIGNKPITKYTNFRSVIEALNNNDRFKEAFYDLFRVDMPAFDKLNEVKISLNATTLQTRLKSGKILNNFQKYDDNKQYYDTVYDIGMALLFNKLNRTTKNLEEVMRCTNPDKFGAKQTIRATRMVLNNIVEYSYNQKNPITNTVLVGNKSLLSKLYPRDINGNILVEQSVYPYLAAFLKYSTILSVEINSMLFPTENKLYNAITSFVQSELNVIFNDDQYREYKQYMMSDIYFSIQYLYSQLTVTDEGFIDLDETKIAKEAINNPKYWNKEISRIYGYEVDETNVDIKDINNPTSEELEKYKQLSPAQKVLWIQSNFDDNSKGIFNYFTVNLFNQWELNNKGYSKQTIRFTDDIDNMNEVYKAFKESFFNTNPLIRLASIDVIKYAFLVEGFRFKYGGVSKCISNETMYKNIEDMGMNIIPVVRELFDKYSDPKEACTTRFIRNFIRSHSDYARTINLGSKSNIENGNNSKFSSLTIRNGNELVFIPFESANSNILDEINITNWNDIEDIRIPYQYVNISRRVDKTNITTLYEINVSSTGVYLIPLNLLERNEAQDVSVNPKNNRYLDYEYYNEIIKLSEDDKYGYNARNYLTAEENKKEINKLQSKHKIPTFKFNGHKVSNINMLKDNYTNPQNVRTQQEIEKFFNDVHECLESIKSDGGIYRLIRTDSYLFRNEFITGQPRVQNIIIGNETVPVVIERVTPSKKFSDNVKKRKTTVEDLNIAERYAYEQTANALFNKSNKYDIKTYYYKVSPVIEEEVKNKVEEQNKEAQDERAPIMNAVTNDISDFLIESNIDNYDLVDKTAKKMIDTVRLAEINGDEQAAKVKEALELKHINEFRSRDLHDNRDTIYGTLANYIELYAKNLNKLISNYKIGDDEYKLNDDKLYERLLKDDNSEEVENIIKLLLECITIGGQYIDIFDINIDAFDDTTKRNIERIRKALNSVRNNTIVKEGLKKVFNKYIANKYSTNPNIRLGLETLDETFGDVGLWDTWIGDANLVTNKEIQTIVKLVNNIMTEATMFDAPRNRKEFLKKFDDIMAKTGSFNWNNIITSDGRLLRPFVSKFIEDRNAIIEKVRSIKEQYGIDSIEYVKAKLERDKWFAENTEQIVVKDYYDEVNTNLENVLNKAPKEYIEYMKLIHELYSNDRPLGILTLQERNRRKEINSKIRQLLSPVKEDGTEKTLDAYERIAVLKEYINTKRDIEDKYFDWKEINNFKEILNNNLDVIKYYKKLHPEYTLDQLLEIDNYRDAYDWIKSNSYYIIDKETNKELQRAFDTLKIKDNNDSNEIKAIIEKADAYDEYGNIDPRKLSEEDIDKIKEITTKKFIYGMDNNAGESILIKDIPRNLPIIKDEFYRMLRADEENKKEVNPRRIQAITKINQLLSKFVAKDGSIHAKDMFEKLTDVEIDELIDLYRTLRNIKGKRNTKEYRERFKKNVAFRTNDVAFNRELVYAKAHLTKLQMNQFIQIFCELDSTGTIVLDKDNNYKPNKDIYGYIEPKDAQYIDHEKTAARRLLEDNVEYIETEYYYDALRKATEEGRFNEWYNANHVYNQYTKKFEPLKIWTTMQIKPEGSLKGHHEYVPTYENKEKHVKDKYKNLNYRPNSINYSTAHGKYNSNVNLSPKEQEMINLLEETMDYFYKNNIYSRAFIEQGYIPRKFKYITDTAWYARQALGLVGLEFRNDKNDTWDDKIDFIHDRHVENSRLSFIKNKGYKPLKEIRQQLKGESDEDYKKYVESIKKENEEIKKKNLEIDNAYLDRDYRIVFAEALEEQTINNAKNRAKNWLYLLQEEIKSNDAYKISKLTGNLITNKKESTDLNTEYKTVEQTNALKVIDTFTRRVIFNQFKEKNKLNKWANLARNITSAKYMILNVTGGIANVGTGFTNIMGEVFANDSISKKDLREAVGMYLKNSVQMIADMYKDTSNNFAVALTKYFEVVDIDAMTERSRGESVGKYIRRVNNLLYGLQSGGEHFMQNSVLFAVLKTSRIFTDSDGEKRCGTFEHYIWNLEVQALKQAIGNDETVMDEFGEYLRNIKRDKKELYKYDSFRKGLCEEFLRAHGTNELKNKYISIKNKLVKDAKEEWKKKPIAIDQLELNNNGEIEITADSELTKDMIIDLKNRVIILNKKIHGVYDKIGAARIEFQWWGGLVMQYHKHIYPGIMKRFRRRGYYNEQLGTVEIGSYVALARFMSIEFKDIKSKIENNESNIALASIQEIIKAVINTITNIRTNWGIMERFEQKAMKRTLGDLYGIVSALLMGIAIYGLTDDDDEKENEFVAGAIYTSDRLLSEAQMYTPWGAIGEFNTLWSSPIAATSGPEDLFKALKFGVQWLFDEDFDPVYKTGLYAGENKVWATLRNNIPAYRVFVRLNNMTKSNSYYRINDKSLNIKLAKAIADTINPD